MSDDGERDSGKMGAFLLGFLVGVLVCLGGGGTFAVIQARQMQMRELAAREEAMAASYAAKLAEKQAQEQREEAEKALREAKEKKEK